MKHLILLFMIVILCVSCDQSSLNIVVFSKTAGYRHKSIPSGIKMFEKLAKENNWKVQSTEDSTFFTGNNLKGIDAVVFLNTTGNIFAEEQEEVFETYIQNGGGFLGIHAAADTEYDWPWYGELVGAYFKDHPNDPNLRKAVIAKTSNRHHCTDHLPERWERMDEWYNYKDINPKIISVLNLDESTYEGGTNGTEHPIAWYHEFDGGRSFYSGGGHTDESFQEPEFVKHLEAALLWTAGENRE